MNQTREFLNNCYEKVLDRLVDVLHIDYKKESEFENPTLNFDGDDIPLEELTEEQEREVSRFALRVIAQVYVRGMIRAVINKSNQPYEFSEDELCSIWDDKADELARNSGLTDKTEADVTLKAAKEAFLEDLLLGQFNITSARKTYSFRRTDIGLYIELQN